MREPLPNPWPGNPNAYPCPWGCNGTGTMPWFSHVQNGVCFACHGNGWILGRGSRPAVSETNRGRRPAPAKPRKRRQWRRVGSRLVEITK